MKKIIFILSILVAICAITSCATTKEITPDLTAQQIMQLGQEAYSNGDYKSAEFYYTATLTRYGMDTQIYIQARYEIGHIAIRTKDYEKAYRNFNEILTIYDSVGAGVLNPSYKVLAQKGISQIPEDKLKLLQN